MSIAHISDITLLYCKTHTKAVVAATVAIVVVEVERTSTGIIAAPTYEEWTVGAVVQTDKVRAR